jgi:hypothetical protein
LAGAVVGEIGRVYGKRQGKFRDLGNWFRVLSHVRESLTEIKIKPPCKSGKAGASGFKKRLAAD